MIRRCWKYLIRERNSWCYILKLGVAIGILSSWVPLVEAQTPTTLPPPRPKPAGQPETFAPKDYNGFMTWQSKAEQNRAQVQAKASAPSAEKTAAANNEALNYQNFIQKRQQSEQALNRPNTPVILDSKTGAPLPKPGGSTAPSPQPASAVKLEEYQKFLQRQQQAEQRLNRSGTPTPPKPGP